VQIIPALFATMAGARFRTPQEGVRELENKMERGLTLPPSCPALVPGVSHVRVGLGAGLSQGGGT
jgi:hypothetical protein